MPVKITRVRCTSTAIEMDVQLRWWAFWWLVAHTAWRALEVRPAVLKPAVWLWAMWLMAWRIRRP